MEELKQYDYKQIPRKPDTKFDKFLDKFSDWFVIIRAIICWAIIVIVFIAIIKIAMSIVF